MEIWKDIAGYEGLYQVSNLGRVRSVKHGKIRLLKLGTDGHGYFQIKFSRGGKMKEFPVHRLVAEAFIPNPSNFPVVNHKDENPANNTVNNLEWCTVKYNTNYGSCQGRRSAKILNGPLAKAVLQYDKSGNLVSEWPSVLEVQRQTGFVQSSISRCCLGKHKSAYGYIWKYK